MYRSILLPQYINRTIEASWCVDGTQHHRATTGILLMLSIQCQPSAMRFTTRRKTLISDFPPDRLLGTYGCLNLHQTRCCIVDFHRTIHPDHQQNPFHINWSPRRQPKMFSLQPHRSLKASNHERCAKRHETRRPRECHTAG